jgi:glycosyltransferase involved in cell wall biosynthesis
LILLYFIQNRSLRTADGVIFLTQYAADVIQRATGKLSHVAVIPHGVSEAFRGIARPSSGNEGGGRKVRCLYVSNAAMYKHQWHVVKAIAEVRRRGHAIELNLVGGGSGRAQQLLDEAISRYDPEHCFVHCAGFVQHDELRAALADADIFVFASSCENMPNTLVEAMAAGLPIACSNRGPMPEVIGDAAILFDPEDSATIADAVEALVRDPELRARCAALAQARARSYSWSRCGDETWEFLVKTAEQR